MATIEEITRLMQELEGQLVACMRCGMCQAVCPLHEQTGRETDVARGKLALLDGLMQKMFANPDEVLERLNRCLLCGSCAANCPSGVEVVDIFLKARAILTGYSGLSMAKRAILRGLLNHPALFDRLAAWGTKFQPLLTRGVNETVGTSCARLKAPLLADRHLVPLAPVPFHRLNARRPAPIAGSAETVAFFVGCLIDKIYPRVAQAVVQALTHHGRAVRIPQGQACCGIPALSAGDTATFRSLVRQNLRLFEAEQYDCLITACATCTATIQKLWPTLFKGGSAEERRAVRQIARRTMDINQYLAAKVGLPAPAAAASAKTVTYHDPCHLGKGLGIYEQPRQLIAANPAYRLQEMSQADTCCGMGGSFNLQHYDISADIGRRKRDQIAASGAEVVATGCPACMVQISDALSRAGDRLAVKHTIEIYAASLPPGSGYRP